MKAVIVYQSLWGNTAAIARAIAEGFGQGAKALSTTEATAEALKGVDLIVAGAPIHAFNLPTAESVKSAGDRPTSYGENPPDISHLLMRDWLKGVPGGLGAAAASFDTRVHGPLGRGGAKRILKALDRVGLTPIVEPRGFYVAMRAGQGVPKGMLLEGEVDRAREWGKELAKLVE